MDRNSWGYLDVENRIVVFLILPGITFVILKPELRKEQKWYKVQLMVSVLYVTYPIW